MSAVRINDRVTIIRADPLHITGIAERAREADRAEVWAAARQTVEQALYASCRFSDYSFTGLIDGKPEAMFGVGTLNAVTRTGTPWLLGTDEIDRVARPFYQGSREFVGWMLTLYAALENYVDDRHDKSKRWLKRIGFHLFEPQIMGYEQRPFRRFEMRAD